MTHRASVWLGTAGALGLLAAASWSAAPAARAQDETPDEVACSVFEKLIDSGNAFCLAQGCEPSERDCNKVCKSATKTCKAISKDGVRKVDDAIKAEARQQKTLCKTADEPKTCKSDSRSARKDAKQETRQFGKDARQACGSSDLVDACLDACNGGLLCTCEGPDLICGR